MTPLDFSQLGHFTGTQQWHRWNPLARNVLLTDGALYVAEEAGAYWLMDAIASYQPFLLKKNEYFQSWKLRVSGSSAELICEDGDLKHLLTQRIEHTDFPERGIELFAIYDGEYTVILLHSEY
jgi:hypothetical protein